jgi:hypothetical protein
MSLLWCRLLVASALVAVATGACSPSPGQAVAERIQAAGSPLVGKVVFRPANFLDPPETDVWLKPGVSEADAEVLWCEVVVPAGGAAEEGDVGVVIWNDAGTQMMATGATCG